MERPNTNTINIEELVKGCHDFSRDDLYKKCIDLSDQRGLFLEFGVHKGDSLVVLSSFTESKFYGFDSFEGLPEDWRAPGDKSIFACDVPRHVESDKVELVQGWFNDTLPKFVEEHSGPVSFIHIDCDLYSSTKCIFDNLKDRISSGTVLLFDEIFGYPGYEEHELKAFEEFLEETKFKVGVIGVGSGATNWPPCQNGHEKAAFIII